jgi:signal transduction histidine kinase
VRRLGRELSMAADPADVLPHAARTVCDALCVPYAAIALDDDGGDGGWVLAEFGRQGVDPEAFPVVHRGVVLGRLLVSPRSRAEAFTSRERALLADLAAQAGVAVHALRLTADLRRSREHLVRSREEERRRLRRELHDGLGPALAGMTLQIGAARVLLDGGEDDRADEALGVLERQLQACVGEVRRVVDDLRPAALDQLGLVAALQRRLEAFAVPGGVAIHLHAPEPVGELPAAVEVAAYRIVTEAVTNTVRHAGARRCDVTLAVDGAVVVEVRDDGCGPPADGHLGVGLTSMRERAEELRGSLSVSRLPLGGTRVRAELPLGGLRPDLHPAPRSGAARGIA